MHVLVATIVHHPDDARISRRQIPAILEAGHTVTYLAPWRLIPSAEPPTGVTAMDVPRATGTRRLAAIGAARRRIRQLAAGADLVLLHDPELLLAIAGLHGLPPVVWDVHEDTAAAIVDKAWIPGPLKPIARRGVRAFERRAERGRLLLLAEEGYAERFSHRHPVVVNAPALPGTVRSPGADRVVYLGRLSKLRGATDLIELARHLPSHVRLELIGPADARVRDELENAHDAGDLVWYRFVPNDQALQMIQGATAGLSLLHDAPNYRHSLPTKVLEYLASGLPVITTPNPQAVRIINESAAGIEVPYRDPVAAAAAVTELAGDASRRRTMAARGRAYVRERYDWNTLGKDFVDQLERFAAVR